MGPLGRCVLARGNPSLCRGPRVTAPPGRALRLGMGPSKRSMAVHANSAPWGQNALGGEITELENAARAEFLKTCSQLTEEESASAAADLLRTAATTRSVQGRLVEGAMLHLEALCSTGKISSETLLPMKTILAGRHKLVFSTATSLPMLQYIPVEEHFSFDASANTVALISTVGPFTFDVHGEYEAVPGRRIDFKFSGMEISLGSKVLNSRVVDGKRKLYDFVFANEDVLVARSSAGGLTLQARG